MARIRTMKPEMRDDVKLASCTRDARLTFVYLIQSADDDGLVLATPRRLVGELYPHDPDVSPELVQEWCSELVRIGAVRWRLTKDGQAVLELVNWEKHQNIKHRSKPILKPMLMPLSSGDHGVPSPIPETLRPFSGEPPEDLGSASRMRQEGGGSGSGESPPPSVHLAPSTVHQSPITSSKQPRAVDQSAAPSVPSETELVSAGSTKHCSLLAAAANKGLTESLGRRVEPIVHSTGATLTEALARAAVPLHFAADRVFAKARTLAKPVRQLGYFTEFVLEQWEQERALFEAESFTPASWKSDRSADGDKAFALRFAMRGDPEAIALCEANGWDYAAPAENPMLVTMAKREAAKGVEEWVKYCTENGIPYSTPARSSVGATIA